MNPNDLILSTAILLPIYLAATIIFKNVFRFSTTIYSIIKIIHNKINRYHKNN